MKNLIKIFMLSQILSSCTPEDLLNITENNVPPKFKMVKLIKNNDTTTYTFEYNIDTTKLTRVLRDGLLYAKISYPSNAVLLVMKMNPDYDDSFYTNLPSNNYFDTLKNLSARPVFFNKDYLTIPIKALNSKLQYATNSLNQYINTYGQLSYNATYYYSNNTLYNTTNNNLIKYNAEARKGTLNSTYRDSIIYNFAFTNQPNLPDQFVTNQQSYFLTQGKPILTPLFLLQQSNIYPYKSHTNLIDAWLFSEIDFPGIPAVVKRDYLYRYSYLFDARSRVTQMDVTVNSADYLTYQFVYFN